MHYQPQFTSRLSEILLIAREASQAVSEGVGDAEDDIHLADVEYSVERHVNFETRT